MKQLKSLFSFALVSFGLMAFANVMQGHDLESVKQLLTDHSEVLYTAAVSPVIAMNAYSGKYEDKLFSTLMNDMEVWGDITTHSMVKSKLTMTKLTVSDGARPYNGIEQVEGDELTYTGLELEVELGQRDFSIEIKKYYKSFLEEKLKASEGSGANQKTIPFAQYTFDQIFKTLAAELNDKTAYFGFKKSDATTYSAGATYSAGDYITIVTGSITDYWKCLATTTAGQSPSTTPAKWQKVNAEAICPGFGYHLQGLITASKVTPVTIGAIDNTNVYAYASHLKLFRAHDTPYKRKGVIHYCSYKDFELLLDDLQDKVAKYTETDRNWTVDGRGIYLYNTNKKCVVLPCSWLGDSRRIISTPKENLHGGTDRLSDLKDVKTRDASNYVAVSSITWVMGFQFRDPNALRVNDQA